MKWFFTFGMTDGRFKLERWECVVLAVVWFWLVVLLGTAAIAIASVTGNDHPHEHCVQQDYVHHAKVGYEWDCVKWAKL